MQEGSGVEESQKESVLRKRTGAGEHLGGDVETQYSGNSLEYIKETLGNPPSMGIWIPNFYNYTRLLASGQVHEPSHKTFDLQSVLPRLVFWRGVLGISAPSLIPVHLHIRVFLCICSLFGGLSY